MAYDAEDLLRLQEKLYDEMIEMPEETEKLIIDVAQEVSKKLYFSPSNMASVEFLDYQLYFGVKRSIQQFKDTIYLAVTCIEGDKKRLFTVEAEINNDLSFIESLRATVASFLRSLVGDYEVCEEE